MQIPEVECHCFIVQIPITGEPHIWVKLKLRGEIPICNTDFHITVHSLVQWCPELLQEEVVRIPAAEGDVIVIHHKHGWLFHQNLVFWGGKIFSYNVRTIILLSWNQKELINLIDLQQNLLTDKDMSSWSDQYTKSFKVYILIMLASFCERENGACFHLKHGKMWPFCHHWAMH